MSFYVRRERDGKVGWVGPIRSELQAGREVAAWQGEGWEAVAHKSTPEIQAQVRAWERRDLNRDRR